METSPKRFEVQHTDPETNIVKREVIEFPGEKFNEVAIKIFDTKNTEYSGHFVDDNTPLGKQVRGKIFHYRLKGSVYQDITIYYEIKGGLVRFVNFKPFIVDGFEMFVSKGESGDLLGCDLKRPRFAPTDGKEVNRIRYVLWATQRFNNGILEDIAAEEDNDDENDISYDQTDDSKTNQDKDDTKAY